MSVPEGFALRPLARGYTREPAVSEEIASLSRLDGRERLQRLVLDGDGAVRPEALIYWARSLRAQGELDAAWTIVDALMSRTARTVSYRISRIYGLSPDDREELADELAVALYEEWLSDGDGYAFWEVRFNLCLNRKLIDLKTRYQQRAMKEVRPVLVEEDAEDPIERIADSRAVSPEQAAIVNSALDSLPPRLKEAWYLQRCAGWTEERVGAYLQCTSRTVRNYLRRAEDILSQWRDMDVEQ